MKNAKELFPGFIGVILSNGIFLLEGYEEPHDFPNCCPIHTDLFAKANAWFENFPDCCGPHRDLAKEEKFKKSDYEGLPRKILDCLSFTEHHISKRIDLPNWYEDITDYILHIEWYAGLDVGLGRYFKYLKRHLEYPEIEMPAYKRRRLIQYIEDKFKPSEPIKSKWLLDIYRDWLNLFPFELSYLAGLKEKMGKVPFAKKPTRMNHYLGFPQTDLVPKAELIDFLNGLTKRLLDEVQTDRMVDEGRILDINKHRYEFAIQTFKTEKAMLLKNYSEGEMQYVTTISKWLDLHEKLFEKIVNMGERHPPKLPAPNARAEKKEPLPKFEDAVKEPDKLPGLWKSLTEMDRPFVNESGGFIGNKKGRNTVKLLALAQAISGMMKPGYSQFETYVMLCTFWDLKPSTRPEKASNQGTWLSTLTEIKHVLA